MLNQRIPQIFTLSQINSSMLYVEPRYIAPNLGKENKKAA